ncbi:alcohol dehydrogenase catalytic domain-containing protein [Cohnella boryungensis]|uniref:Alcohol dehydrogenase catalytic domain-containing protein n=1 Tax=Cohnella boryungensis TaxID=768479 RepID=A0ABV8SJN7_9BACL
MNQSNLDRMMTVPKFVGEGKIEYGEKEIPSPGPGQLLIAVKANALCGSDRWQFQHGTEIVPGHEAAGIVAQAGPGTKTPIGAQGVVFLMGYCGSCRNCVSDLSNLCLNKRADYGFSHDGGYAPYITVNENVFFETDPSLPLTEATMLLDIMGTGGHAIKRGQKVIPVIQSSVVAGAGPIGLGVAAMMKLLLGDIPVLVTDYNEYRLNLAAKLGAIPVDLSRESLTDVTRSSGLDGFDLAVDTSGKTEARHIMLKSLRKPGALVCVGHGEALNLKVSEDLIATERTVLGSEYFRYEDLQANHELIKEHLDYLRPIITHRYSLGELQKAYEIFFKGNTGKVIIEQ